jgi:hypothetical protein
MSNAGLDQLVKGSPPPNVSLNSVAAKAATPLPNSIDLGSNSRRMGGRTVGVGVGDSTLTSTVTNDPTTLLPSAPPQIYLNLLILEASLRAQYLSLRARRRQHAAVLVFLAAWTMWFFYAQFLRPRADGSGVGGSQYWLIDMSEKVALISGVVMGILIRLTGQWERGIRWPGRWLRVVNRGLRGFNCKVVVIRGPWWREIFGMVVGMLSFAGLLVEGTPGSDYRVVDTSSPGHEEIREKGKHGMKTRSSGSLREKSQQHYQDLAEEDIAPGGDYIKILLLPKNFTPEFREDWEVYRAEYWEAENIRRASLRTTLRDQQRHQKQSKRRREGGWWSATGSWWSRSPPSTTKGQTGQHWGMGPPQRTGSTRHKRGSSSIREKDPMVHSRSSSRSSAPPPLDGIAIVVPTEERERRWSTASTASSTLGMDPAQAQQQKRRRRKVANTPADGEKRSSIVGTAAAGRRLTGSGSRPGTPNAGDVVRARGPFGD